MVRTGSSSAATTAGGPVWAAQLFLLSLAMPVHLQVGSLLLMPHRIVLLLFFLPFFFRLFVFRQAGPVLAADWLMFGSAIWATVALFVNHPAGSAIEPAGIHLIEFFGAYLLARVAIRSAADFRKMVWMLFLMIVFLLPFAAIESITRRPILLELMPGNSLRPVNIGLRWGMRRAQGVFAHPILFGVFVSTGLGLFWYALRPRWLRFIGAPAAVLATVFSLSTGALISIVIQSLFIGWEMILKVVHLRWRIFTILAVIGYFAIDLLSNRSPFHVLVTYATFSTGSAYNRIHIWNFGTDNVAANPIFGLGLNDWVRPSWMGDSVDNFWLLLTMRYGLPMIVMVILALALILRRVARAELADPDDRLARAGYLVTFGGLFIAGGTVHYWHAMMAFALFIFGSGLWAATGGGIDRTADEGAPEEPPQRMSRYSRQPTPGVPIGASPRRSMGAVNRGQSAKTRR